MDDTIKPGDRVKILVGKLPCSDFRPFAGSKGTVTKVWEGNRYAVSVQLDHACNLVYHRGEVQPLATQS